MGGAPKFASQDVAITALVFLLVLLSASLVRIDETPCESAIPAVGAFFAMVGLLLSLPVNFPPITVVHLVNGALGSNDTGYYPISYDAYFVVLPWITAGIYAALTWFLLKRRHSRGGLGL